MSIGHLARGVFATVLLVTASARAAAERNDAPAARPRPQLSISSRTPTDLEVGIRAGDHPGYGRIVFDLPTGTTVHSVAEGNRILLVFTGAERLGPLDVLPRNLARLQGDATSVTLTLKPGVRAHQQQLGSRLVLDLLDPRASPANGRLPSRAERLQARSSPPVVDAPEALGRTAASTPEASEPDRAPPPAPGADHPEASVAVPITPADPATASPVAVQEVALAPPKTPASAGPSAQPEPASVHVSALLSADTSVGAAAFRRGDWGLVVLDRRLPLAAPIGLPGALVQQGALWTVIQVPLQAGQALTLDRMPTGWAVGVVDVQAPGLLVPQPVPDGVAFSMRRVGQAVTILDPETGGALLIGTSLAAGNDAATGVERRAPAFTILPTWLGVAIEPVSDQADLHAEATAFVLHGASIPPDPAATASRLDLPDDAVPALLNRLHAQLASAAAAPPRARSQPRLAAVQAMLALGMGVEAQALVQTIVADDPEAASDAKLGIAGGIAAVMAGRFDEASALDKPELADDPELDLWRGLRDRGLGRQTENVRHLPAHLALAGAYPQPLRRLVWPELAEAAAASGVPIPADQMTPYAAALALEHAGKLDEAVAAWQSVATGPDPLDQVRATVHLTELQLAAGRIGPLDAARVMERQSYAWRGDTRELALRLRAAELQSAAGEWRAALDWLRATDALFPGQKEAIRARKAGIFESMMSSDGAKLSAFDTVMLATDYADCVPEDGKDARFAKLLTDKLMALDLPARAIPVLQGLVTATKTGPARAEFGLRLGQLLLEGGDAAGAMTALQASDAPDLDTGLLESRGLINARAQAAQGHVTEAVQSLGSIHTAAAAGLRASLLEQAGDWKGSLDALAALATVAVPAEGALSDAAQSLVMREATAAVQAHAPDELRRLAQFIPRMSGASADMLRMLTEPAITSTRELPRSANELKLARAVPGEIQGLAAH